MSASSWDRRLVLSSRVSNVCKNKCPHCFAKSDCPIDFIDQEKVFNFVNRVILPSRDQFGHVMMSFMGGEITQLPYEQVENYILGLIKLFTDNKIYPSTRVLTEGNYDGEVWDNLFSKIIKFDRSTAKLHHMRKDPVVRCGGVHFTVNRYTYTPKVIRNIKKIHSESDFINIGFTYDKGLKLDFFKMFFDDLGFFDNKFTFSLANRKRMDTLEMPVCSPPALWREIEEAFNVKLQVNTHDDGALCNKDSQMHRIILNPNGTIVPDPMFPAEPVKSKLLSRFDAVRLDDIQSLKQLEETEIYRWAKDVINMYGGKGRCPIELWIEENK